MFDAQTINLQGTGSANPSTVVYSPWFSRGGDYGLFTVEGLKFSNTADDHLKLKVDMVHKPVSEPGNGDDIANSTFSVAGNAATTRVTMDMSTAVSGFTGFKELVRYKFTLTTTDSPATTVGLWAIFRMFAPVWYDKV
jgi:hypothetical protein